MSTYKEILEKLREYKKLQDFICDYVDDVSNVDLDIKKYEAKVIYYEALDNFTMKDIVTL